MRDYVISYDWGRSFVPVAQAPTPELVQHLAAIAKSECGNTGINGATGEEVAERIRIELLIRERGF